MIKIGDFARLSQVSVVTLRHYDDLGLLKPVSVDRFTGYRYYSVSQLPRLNRILALKDLGFSLEQIADVLAEGVTSAQLSGMLKMKRAEVERQLADEQARLARIEARLRQIEQEDSVSNYDIVLKTVPSIRVVSRRVTVPTNDQVPVYLDSAYMAVYEYIHQQGAKKIGPAFTVWHSPADVYVNEDVEAVLPIDRALPGTEVVKVYELPQTQVASVVHHGDFSDFQQGHIALMKWIEDNGYRIAGPYREIYIHHDHQNLSDSTTEIQFPVEKI